MLLFSLFVVAQAAPLEVTFPPAHVPRAGDRCVYTFDLTMRVEGDPALQRSYGTTRGGRQRQIFTVLEVDAAGSPVRMKVVFEKDVSFVVRDGFRTEEKSALDGNSYLPTRETGTGAFADAREDGRPLTNREREALADEYATPPIIDFSGRTFRQGEIVLTEAKGFDRFGNADGPTELKLGRLEKVGKAKKPGARMDYKFLVDIAGDDAGAALTMWATVHTSLDGSEQRTTVEGPIRIAADRPVSGIRLETADILDDVPLGADDPSRSLVLKGTVAVESTLSCTWVE